MPTSKREKLLRKQRGAMTNLDQCLTKLQFLQEIYAPAHPEQHAMISLIALAVIENQTLLEQFKKEYM